MSATDTVRISKRLSLWLRHSPQSGGLSLDASGWAEVNDVLAALAKSRPPADRLALEQVVRDNDKQRFELSPDGRRIRARQGHSIAVEGDWTPAAPPGLLYHGTIDRFLPAILSEGLRPMNRHHVHLSPDVETARRVGGRRGKPVILRVDAAALAAQGHRFFLSGNGVWLTDHVPLERLQVASSA